MKAILEAELEQNITVQQSLQALMHCDLVYIDEHYPYWSCGVNRKLVYLTSPQTFPGINKLGQLWNEIGNEYNW